MHRDWSDAVAESVPTNSADQKPDGLTDYPEHHQDLSATPRQEADYHAALAELIRSYGG